MGKFVIVTSIEFGKGPQAMVSILDKKSQHLGVFQKLAMVVARLVIGLVSSLRAIQWFAQSQHMFFSILDFLRCVMIEKYSYFNKECNRCQLVRLLWSTYVFTMLGLQEFFVIIERSINGIKSVPNMGLFSHLDNLDQSHSLVAPLIRSCVLSAITVNSDSQSEFSPIQNHLPFDPLGVLLQIFS